MLGVAESERALEMADEASARFDVEAVVAHLSTALRGYTAVDAKCSAAMVCVRLGDTLANALGNLTASRAWFARARRLVEHEPPCLEQGWVAVAAMGCDVDDPDVLLAAAQLALDRARRFGNVNLETKALADAGLAHVQTGRVIEGMALLDEAMALACGPADDPDTVAKSVCSFFTACYFATDFERAASWAGLLRTHGLIGAEAGGPAYLSSHCDSVQATLLLELGRWGEAEVLLVRAQTRFEAVMQAPSWHPDIALADLRIRQGRFADAEALLLGKEQSMQALLPASRLHLERGDHDLARVTAHRGLRVMGKDRLRAGELLAVLVDTELAAGDLDAAAAACAALTELGDLGLSAHDAHATAARSRVLAATGDLSGAIAALEGTVDLLSTSQLPWRRGRLRLELARLRDKSGDATGAMIDARAAAAALGVLDVVLTPAELALLDRLGPSRSDQPPAAPTATLLREGKWWVVTCRGSSVRVADSKGLRYLAELLARPGVERHAFDLVDRVEGVSSTGAVDRRTLGDAGALIDPAARAAYRRRIEELRTEIDDALDEDRLDAAEALQAEVDQFVAQLAQAFGLGGRDRRAASAAERARLNVTRALRAATAKLAEAMPGAGAVLDRRVRTGLYCAYEPAVDDDVRWIVQT